MRHTWNIERRMGISSPTLNDLTIDWLAETLEKDLKLLKLDNTVICNRDLALELLRDKYNSTKAMKLYGYLISRQSLTRKQLMRSVCENTLRGMNKDLHNAGVALAMTDKVSLKSLKIERKPQIFVDGLK